MNRKLYKILGVFVLWNVVLAWGAPIDEDQHYGCPKHKAGRERKGKVWEMGKNMFGGRMPTDAVKQVVLEMVEYSPGFSQHMDPNKISNWENVYLFFPDNVGQTAKSFYLEKGHHERLDIQGDAGHNLYVQLQLQVGSGQKPDHCLASVNVKKGIFYDWRHLMYCLKKSYDTKENGQNPKTIRSDDLEFVSNKKSAKKVAPKGRT